MLVAPVDDWISAVLPKGREMFNISRNDRLYVHGVSPGLYFSVETVLRVYLFFKLAE